MKDRKFKMRIPQLLLAILLVLAIIALICYGYYKQTQVIDKYEEYIVNLIRSYYTWWIREEEKMNDKTDQET